MPSFPNITGIRVSPSLEGVQTGTVLPEGSSRRSLLSKVTNKKIHKSEDTLLPAAIGKIKNYMRRIGFALLGMEAPENGVSVSSKIQDSSAKSEAEETSINDSDPIIGSWPTGFNSPVAPPPKTLKPTDKTNNEEQNIAFAEPQAPVPISTQKIPQEFGQLMQDLNQSQNDNQSMMEALKAMAAGGGGFDAGGML